MSLTSLGVGSNGLLDRGGLPTLHMASMGLLRTGVVVDTPIHSGGGRAPSFAMDIARARSRRKERLERLRAELAPDTQPIIDAALSEGDIDLAALELRIEQARQAQIDAANALDGQERARAAVIAREGFVSLDIAPDEILRSDLNLRLLLLLGC